MKRDEAEFLLFWDNLEMYPEFNHEKSFPFPIYIGGDPNSRPTK